MLVLALDTSTPAVTVALHDGTRLLAESATVDARRHTELLAPAVVAVLAEAGADRRDLTAVAVGVGPGPFTGLRIGLVTARILGAALSVPVHGMCSLDIIARRVAADGSFVVATDARRREVYWAAYDAGGHRMRGPSVVAPAEVATDLPVAGEGARLYPEAFPNPVEPLYPRAADLAESVVSGSPELLPPEPLYLRRPDARPPGTPKPVLSR
ncbi:MAG: tRNA (adenosine(37)-N6)-threonylcarbamoyltransferase complex dimerization subunit type 1 TsaB [Jiangellaceae bacterium]